ncbi:hypothetical protein [Saccharopolyspora sp. NPDC002686]|uniref:hypothetical protein n=1 Tax=Saccharopolyspora sp. NPDC002686 TaxID=3154541 RepID=UPI003319F485
MTSPSWLGAAVLAVIDRLDEQRCELLHEISVDAAAGSAAQMKQMAALYARRARCWRVLATHATARLVWKPAITAAMNDDRLAQDYLGFAESRREFEQRRTELRAARSAGGVK